MTTSQTAATTGLPKYTAGDAVDHAAMIRVVAEGLYLAAHGLSDVDERDAMAALIMHLKKQLDSLVDGLRKIHQEARS